MLLHNNDRSGKSEYWFQQKFLGASREIFVSNPDTGNEFHAQPTVTQQEAPEVGFLVFGCSSDFSVSNEERFSVDRNNLHFIVDYLARNSSFSKLAVLVICYRSPMDDEPADPNGLDSSRTLGKARRERVESVKAALNFAIFPRTVVGKKVVMVETLRDLDLSHELRMFAEDYILETVSPRYSGDGDGPPNNAAAARKAITAPVNRKKGGTDGEVVRRKAQDNSPGHSPEGRKRRRAVVHTPLRTPVPASRSTAVKRTGDSVVQDSPYKRYCRKKREQGVLDNAKMRMKALIGFSMVLQSPTASNDNDDQSPPLSLQSAPSPDAPSPPRPRPSPRPSQAQQEVDTATANAKIKNRVDKIVEDADKTAAEILKFFSENE